MYNREVYKLLLRYKLPLPASPVVISRFITSQTMGLLKIFTGVSYTAVPVVVVLYWLYTTPHIQLLVNTVNSGNIVLRLIFAYKVHKLLSAGNCHIVDRIVLSKPVF